MTSHYRRQTRSKPVQQRSRLTIERLIDTTAQVLVEDGYESASTNRIAARAGVGVGSLYRYFTDKDELVDATVGRVQDQIERQTADAIIAAMAHPIKDGIRDVLEAVTTVLESHAPLLRVVIDQVPHTGGTHTLGDIERRLSELGRAYLVHHLGPREPAELQPLVFLATGTTLTTCIRIALDRPADVDRTALLDHASRMLNAWFQSYTSEN
ncbi:TetR/AcrR family transcriptional regulator [Mycolicibacterium sp. Dal123E01]|uniref:TetR/AcrR family transcriptional regulator n=1 Tax=Mycolicibacterium sp. Dal123E01 TaxID=3457578 RepID=UPI00403ED630